MLDKKKWWGGFAVLISLLASLSLPSQAVQLPGAMSEADIGQLVQDISQFSVTKVLRSAEPYNDFFPGLKIGIEINILLPQDTNLLGDGTGSIPGFIPTPRLYLAKSLFYNLEFIFSFMPASLSNIVSTTGGILKWSFYNEKESFISAAAYAGYTAVSAFNGVYSGRDIELGIYASKDFVRIRPYLGLAMLFADGTVPPVLAKSVYSVSQNTLHAFLGIEIIMPVELTFQLDVINLSPRGSMLVGKTF